MTIHKPSFEWKLTLGSVIHIGILLFAIIGGWFRLEAKTDRNTRSIEQISNQIYELRAQQKKRQEDIDTFWKEDWSGQQAINAEVLTLLKIIKTDISEIKGDIKHLEGK